MRATIPMKIQEAAPPGFSQHLENAATTERAGLQHTTFNAKTRAGYGERVATSAVQHFMRGS